MLSGLNLIFKMEAEINNKNKIIGIFMVVLITLFIYFTFFTNESNEITENKIGNNNPTSQFIEQTAADKIIKEDSTRSNTISKFVEEQLAKGKNPNKLINEKSPYLLQHAFNPVNWYPWGEEAFEKARKENKPIFLSVGYSTCYWCHVMEREVFENEGIAALMNQYVVSIKVDREERPDVDRVYMTALQAMTGGGGWPMSMFITQDLKPFYGGTYIPPVAKYGRAGFPEILEAIHNAWLNNKQAILQNSKEIATHISNANTPEVSPTNAGKTALERGFDSFSRSYDSQYSGFGKQPKFPRPVAFNFLLRYYSRYNETKALDMSLETLKQMAKGGMYDHIGGGFHRYATDQRWHVPHFEKMLYDQAQLVISYLDAYQITGEKFYADVAHDILKYVQRNMTHPEGGFYSAEDAESAVDISQPHEKEEGAFYTWYKREIDGILNKEEAEVFNFYYGVKDKGNVEPGADPHGEFTGENILYMARSIDETVNKFNLTEEKIALILSTAKEKIFLAREQRPKSHLDDKILVSWNGLMISAFARAYQVLDEDTYLASATKAAKFIVNNLYDSKNEKLLRRYRDGEAKYDAHLEDYAFFTQGLIDLYEASLNFDWLKTSINLTTQQVNLFYDSKDGGFYDISGKDPSIIIKTKESYDGAEPTGNSIAILNLLRLSQMTDNENWRKAAEKSLSYFGERMLSTPQGLAQFLVALDFSLSKPKQIIIAGKSDDKHTNELLREVHSRFIPNKIILLADGKSGQKTLASYIPFLESVEMIDGKSTAYICENYACKLPTSDVSVVAKLLRGE